MVIWMAADIQKDAHHHDRKAEKWTLYVRARSFAHAAVHYNAA